MNKSTQTNHSGQYLHSCSAPALADSFHEMAAARDRQSGEIDSITCIASRLGVPRGLLADAPRKLILLLVGLGDLVCQLPIDTLRLVVQAGAAYHDADDRATRGRERSGDRALIVAFDTLIGAHNISNVDQYARAVGAALIQGKRDGLWAAYLRHFGDPGEHHDRNDRTVVECPRCGMTGIAERLHLSTRRGTLGAALCSSCQHEVTAACAWDASRWVQNQ